MVKVAGVFYKVCLKCVVSTGFKLTKNKTFGKGQVRRLTKKIKFAAVCKLKVSVCKVIDFLSKKDEVCGSK